MVIKFPSAAPVIADAKQREAALDISASFIVEAPAGSGKTGLLMQRFLKLLAQVDQPEQVLALTFTNKATGEMRERITAALRSAQTNPNPPAEDYKQLTHTLALAVLQRDSERGWGLLERIHRLNIRTIDALCGTIARSVPLDAGIAAFASPIDNPRPLYRQAAHAVMMRFGGDDEALNDAIHTVLIHRDGDLDYCEGVLAEMLGTREQWGSLVPRGEELNEEYLETVTLPRLNQSLDRTLCAALTRIHASFDEDHLQQLADILRELAFAEGYNDEPSAFSPCANLTALGTTASAVDHWLLLANLLLTGNGDWRKSYAKNHIRAVVPRHIVTALKDIVFAIGDDNEEFKQLLCSVRALPPATFPPHQWTVTKALFRLLQHAWTELQILFASEEVCDFSEVTLAARAALRTNPDTQALLGTRLQHILVDEMQDTSVGQYELLQLLTQGWDGRSQTVFLVGDPKQSIYLFRQARVELFGNIAATGKLGDLTIAPLLLTTNFRSGASLVAQVNNVFTTVFPSADDGNLATIGDVAFHPATAALPPSSDDAIEWNISVQPPRDKDLSVGRRRRRKAAQREAKTIAAAIAQSRTSHVGRQSIAILVRARSHVTEITKALRSLDIPYRAIDMDPLSERQEVLDILAVTRALIHPGDRTAWLAVMRAPWCGLTIAELHTVAGGDNRSEGKQSLRTFMQQRAHALPRQSQARALRVLTIMDAALQHTGASSLSDLVERTWRSLGGDLGCTALELENIAEFLKVLDAMENDGEPVTVQSLDARLQRLFARPGTAAGAVEVMTIHKSKGLEWDLVFVPGMHRNSANEGWRALDWLELPTRSASGDFDLLLAPLPGKGDDPSSLNTYIREVRRQRRYAELKRVFYVAATRAKTQLHLSAWPESSASNGAIVPRGTLLNTTWGFAEQYAQPLVEQQLPATQQPEEALALAAAAEIIPFPVSPNLPATADDDDDRVRRFPKIQHIAAEIDPLARLHAAPPWIAPAQTPVRFNRPQGTFGARAVGNVIHAFTERLAKTVAQRCHAGTQPTQVMDALRTEVLEWSSAIRALLRAGSLPPDAADRASATVLQALTTTLNSRDGRWLLHPHTGAVTEQAWQTGTGDDAVRIRLDRSFYAGETPGSTGDSALWIVDFKTGDHTGNVDAFLSGERAKYEDQLNFYAATRSRALAAGVPIHLGLFYPLMGRLLWWRYEPEAPATPESVGAGEEQTSAEPQAQVQLPLFR